MSFVEQPTTATKFKFTNGETPKSNQANYCQGCRFTSVLGAANARSVCYGPGSDNHATLTSTGSSEASSRPCVEVTQIVSIK